MLLNNEREEEVDHQTEKLLLCKNKTKLVYVINNTKLDNLNSSKAIIWDPRQSCHGAPLDFDMIRMLKGTILEIRDIRHILNPEYINMTDSNGYNLLMKAITFENVEIVEYIINWAIRESIKINLRTSTTNEIKGKSAIECCLESSNKNLLLTLKNGLLSNLVGPEETIELITENRDLLRDTFPEVFVEWVRMILEHKSNNQRHLSKKKFKNRKYKCLSNENTECPNWLLKFIHASDPQIKSDFELIKKVT